MFVQSGLAHMTSLTSILCSAYPEDYFALAYLATDSADERARLVGEARALGHSSQPPRDINLEKTCTAIFERIAAVWCGDEEEVSLDDQRVREQAATLLTQLAMPRISYGGLAERPFSDAVFASCFVSAFGAR